MMRKHLIKLALIFVTLLISKLILAPSSVQASPRFLQPFSGTYRLTAYVDHRSPNYTLDDDMVVYNGEEHLNCPEPNSSWNRNDQGPFCYDGHNATDYALPNNTQVLAAAGGVVTWFGWRSNYYGNSIRIDHGSGYETWYSHLSNFSVGLNSEVVTGQLIGFSGNSGVIPGTNTPQPYHLHFEIQRNGQVTDPFGWRGDWADPLPSGPATCLWGDKQCFETIVEDGSERFYESGTTWLWHHQGNSWTMSYVSNAMNFDTALARWKPNLPNEGIHAVYAFVPAIHATTQNAKYQIHDKDGHDHFITINQQNLSDEWIYLGSYLFWDNSVLGFVQLGNATGETAGGKEVNFDSMKFVQYRIFIPTMYD